MKGTWREGYLAGDPGGYVEKALEMGISFQGAQLENLEEGSPTRDFERWMKGALGMDCLSLKRLSREDLEGRGAPLLGTLEEMLRKAPETGISLHRGPFTTEGNLESETGLIYWGL